MNKELFEREKAKRRKVKERKWRKSGRARRKEELTNWPSSIIFSDHVDSIEEIFFEFLEVGRSRKASRDARDHNVELLSLHGRRRRRRRA